MVDRSVRSGAELRKRARLVRVMKSKKYSCPKTGKKVKRISNSLWRSASGHIYAGGAYSLSTPSGEVLERMVLEHKEKRMKKKAAQKKEEK